MKRSLSYTFLLMALSVAARPAIAQPSPDKVPVDAARAQYREAIDRATKAWQSYRATEAPADVQEDLRGKLQPLVEETFDARQRLQRAEVAELRRRIAEIEKAIEEREKHKDAIIGSRLNELLTQEPGNKQVPQLWQERLENERRKRTMRPDTEARPGAKGADTFEPASNQEDPFRDDQTRPDKSPGARSLLPDASDNFDLQTRERLAQLDVQAAEAELANAEKGLNVVRKRYESASIPYDEVLEAEKRSQEAKFGAQRARIKLDAFAKQRAEQTQVPGPRQGSTDGSPASGDVVRQPISDEFDLDTRERLAQLDVQDAESGLAGANEDLANAQELRKQNAISANEVRSYERKHRHALAELERAKLRLHAIERQRADLAADSDISVAEAEAKVQKAKAAVQAQSAARMTFVAQSQKAAADVAKAEASYEYEQKQYQRMKDLADTKSIDVKLLDEAEERLKAAKASLDGAQAAVAAAASQGSHSDFAREELEADLRIAEAQLRAAQQRRDRLVHRDAVDHNGAQRTSTPQPGNESAKAKAE